MRTIAFLLLSFTFIALTASEPQNNYKGRQFTPEERTKFREWRLKYGRKYHSLAEEDEARLKMLANSAVIDAHNKLYKRGLVKFKRGLWKHSDMSPEDKKHNLLGGLDPRFTRSYPAGPSPPEFASGPPSVDWRKQNLVAPVEEQGWCGSCWAFSAKGVIEAVLRKKNITTHVAPQQLLDCSKLGCYGCHGGWPKGALDYVRDNGFTSEDKYPYLGYDHTCEYNKNLSVGVINQTYVVWTNGNETMLKNIVGSVGPTAIFMRIEESFYNYESGIYYEPTCGTSVNHCMLLIGYGTDPVGGDYWLVKNSWGDSWGENGYVRFARNKGNNCNIAHSAAYAT